MTFIFFSSSKVCSRWTTEIQWHTETLSSTESDISTPFARSSQKHEAHDVGSNSYFRTIFVATSSEIAIVADTTIRCRILKNSTKYRSREIERSIIANKEVHALWEATSFQYVESLRENVAVNEKSIYTSFLLVARTERHHHSHSFGSSSCFVEKRAVSQRKSSEVSHHCLEIQQSLETTL